MSRKPNKKPREEAPRESPDLALPKAPQCEIGAARPTLADLESARLVEVSYLIGDGPVRIAGLVVGKAPKVFEVAHVRGQGKSHMRALATDPSISVRIVE